MISITTTTTAITAVATSLLVACCRAGDILKLHRVEICLARESVAILAFCLLSSNFSFFSDFPLAG